MCNYFLLPICQMGKLRPRERKGVGQGSIASSFREPSGRASGSCQVEGEPGSWNIVERKTM